MRNHLRLKFIVPLVVVALGGLAVAKFVLLKDSGEAEAAAPATPSAQTEPAAPSTETEPATTDEQTTTEEPAATAPVGLAKLDAALKKNKVVVVVVYSPDGAVDTVQVSQAREAASDVKAGFLALNGVKEKEIADFATAYDVRTTPCVLVFRRGPELVQRFDTVVDNVTVAQAAQDARQGS